MRKVGKTRKTNLVAYTRKKPTTEERMCDVEWAANKSKEMEMEG